MPAARLATACARYKALGIWGAGPVVRAYNRSKAFVEEVMRENELLRYKMLHLEQELVRRQEASQAQATEVNRAQLGVADLAQPVADDGLTGARAVAMTELHTMVDRSGGLHRGEKVLVLRHGGLPFISAAIATRSAGAATSPTTRASLGSRRGR